MAMQIYQFSENSQKHYEVYFENLIIDSSEDLCKLYIFHKIKKQEIKQRRIFAERMLGKLGRLLDKQYSSVRKIFT